MKKIIILLLSFVSIQIYAQNNLNKTDDVGRVTLAAVIDSNIDGMTPSSKTYLQNKLNLITSKYGMGGESSNERFIITANVQIITKDITATAPPMQAYTLEVSFFIGDGIEGKLFSSTAITVKGVGTTETKAYKSALKNIKTNDPRLKNFIEEGKNKIVEYYNSQCDFIIKESDMLISKGEFESAIYTLIDIPEVCKECYDKAMDAVEIVYQKQIDFECQSHLMNANNAWNESMNYDAAKNASKELAKINPNSNCYADAKNLTNKIASKIEDLNQEAWDFKLKQQQDNVDLRKVTIKAARDIGVAYGENQPKSVTYSYRGWY